MRDSIIFNGRRSKQVYTELQFCISAQMWRFQLKFATFFFAAFCRVFFHSPKSKSLYSVFLRGSPMKKYTLGMAFIAYSLSYSITPCPLTPNVDGVYEIGTYEQLKQVALCPLDGTYRLIANIDASASASEN